MMMYEDLLNGYPKIFQDSQLPNDFTRESQGGKKEQVGAQGTKAYKKITSSAVSEKCQMYLCSFRLLYTRHKYSLSLYLDYA